MQQNNLLELERCPCCQIAHPQLQRSWNTTTQSQNGTNSRNWVVYCCRSCGGLILTSAQNISNAPISEIYPKPKTVHQAVPERARQFLSQAISSIHAPAGAVMLTASSIDAMLKEKGYQDGSLYNRIDESATNHLITQEMAEWAHEIRLDANDQRHADESASLPNEADAQKVIEFAEALAQFLFVLPARVASGRQSGAN